MFIYDSSTDSTDFILDLVKKNKVVYVGEKTFKGLGKRLVRFPYSGFLTISDINKYKGYTLILDRIDCFLTEYALSEYDLSILYQQELIEEQGIYFEWVKPDYEGFFSPFKELVEKKELVSLEGKFYRVFPFECLKVFKDTYYLTTYFEGDINKVILEVNCVPLENLTKCLKRETNYKVKKIKLLKSIHTKFKESDLKDCCWTAEPENCEKYEQMTYKKSYLAPNSSVGSKKLLGCFLQPDRYRTLHEYFQSFSVNPDFNKMQLGYLLKWILTADEGAEVLFISEENFLLFSSWLKGVDMESSFVTSFEVVKSKLGAGNSKEDEILNYFAKRYREHYQESLYNGTFATRKSLKKLIVESPLYPLDIKLITDIIDEAFKQEKTIRSDKYPKLTLGFIKSDYLLDKLSASLQASKANKEEADFELKDKYKVSEMSEKELEALREQLSRGG